LAALGFGALPFSNAEGAGLPPAGQQIEFSRPTSANDVNSTNLSPFKPITDALPSLEQREQGTLDFLRPESSLDGLPAPAPQYLVIPSRRLKERLERQKNWASMTPEEILLDDSTSFSAFSAEDSSKPSDSQTKDKRSRPNDPGSDRQKGRFSLDSSTDSDWSSASRRRDTRSGSSDEADLPANIKASEKQLRELQKTFRTDTATASSPFSTDLRANSGFSDFFGSESPKSDWLQQAAHNKAIMEQFKQSIESPLNPPLFLSPALSSSIEANPLESIFGSTPGNDPMKSSPLGRSPFFQSDGLDARSSAPLALPSAASDGAFAGQSSLSAQPGLQPAQQPSLTPPTPTFVFPKRAFQ
jgi:hypothetical protein